MKSIFYKTNSLELDATIRAFCADEGFNSHNLSTEQVDVMELSFGILLLDAEFSKYYKGVKIPVAFFGNPQDYGTSYYALDNNVSNLQLKLLVDVILNGGVINNISSACNLESFSYTYFISNNIFSIDKIVYNITKDLVYFFKLSDLQKIRIGLSEIITNAIEHGNLEITGEEKFQATEDDSYYNLVDERLNNPKYKDRKVKITLYFKKPVLKIVVEDRGKGFDTSKIKKVHSEEDLFKLHGRGILIARMYFNEINYNKKGNKVTLIKRVE